ncbi:hypothetical protein C1645_731700 [Glomus cerebriforme]|uniref:Uncharacterized protein n=1 Tax=Glomus cerebriforme TaxID=658196 RepID=A0A397TNK1_9GLOM|nr:hypothetical protein C1645_731700 [Glomus cerebriforme]
MDKELKELYSKACVAESLKLIINKTSDEAVDLKEYEKFSYNLATILVRDKEVVAVRLIPYSDKCVIYLAKNDIWDQKDFDYVKKVRNYVQSLSKDAPILLKEVWKREDVKGLFKDIMKFCSTKLKTRFEKLKKDIINNQHEPYIKSFLDYASIEIESLDKMSGYDLSGTCSKYYKGIKNSTAPKKFLKYIKKVGSYHIALHDITTCACKQRYKNLFSNIQVHKLNPITIHQPIYSWKNIVERYIPNFLMYDKFKRRCLSDNYTLVRLKDIYNKNLDKEGRQDLFLHAEMNILTNIIDENHKDEGPIFIAVSKRSCYLCELYIKFAQRKGYKIFISGMNKKLYHRWMFPNIKDTSFRTESLKYMIKSLNTIIREEIEKHINIVLMSDSDGESGDSETDPNSFEDSDELMKAENPERTDFY